MDNLAGPTNVSWEQRLREMVLAGNTLAAAACSGSGGSNVVDASDPSSFACCNASPDPCCEYISCGGPLSLECSEEMACKADGGTWNYVIDGCNGDAGTPDANSDAPEAGPFDGGMDGNGEPD